MLLNSKISRKFIDEFKRYECFSVKNLMHLNTRQSKIEYIQPSITSGGIGFRI